MAQPTHQQPASGGSKITQLLRQQARPVHLEVKDLRVWYRVEGGYVKAVDGVSFEVKPGAYLGLVGESGCGKTTVIKAIHQLLPDDAVVTGQILLDGQDLLKMSRSELRKIRWTRMSLITQSAMNSLDPVYRIGDQITEAIRAHVKASKAEAWERAAELFEIVGLAPERLKNYPHQFSGGMRQRAVIALSLALEPGLIIGDEPTTALDVITQDQILYRIRRIQEQVNTSMILVTHDISVVAETCDAMAVMYAGEIAEYAPTLLLFQEPCHPYTMGLKNAFPTIRGGLSKLLSIPGSPPDLVNPPQGCRFAERCPFSTSLCWHEEPELREAADGHYVACHYADRADEMRQKSADKATWNSVAERILS